MADVTGEVTELITELIRNACVNDGTVESGQEVRNVETLRACLDGTGMDFEIYESEPGRQSMVARIEGSDPDAPSLMLMGHTDVVPANPDRWQRDPFGGEVVDGVVWGRGAVDMLNLTSSMAVAMRRLADSGFTPNGDLVYLGVADEEAGGRWGAKWLVENEPDAVRTDWVVTEFGGPRIPMSPPDAPALPVAVAEKGAFWGTMRITGTPGHGSMPFRSDNALATAAEAVRRIWSYRPPAAIGEVWQRFVDGLSLPDELRTALVEPAALDAALESIDDVGLARFIHACTHETIAPNVMHAGVKTNVIPDTAVVDLDIRTLPGTDEGAVRELLADALGDLSDRVEIEFWTADVASASPLDTPLWDAMQRLVTDFIPGGRNIPCIVPGATDSRFLRGLGATCHGYGVYSDRVSFADFMGMFHGDDERIDQESLRLSTEFWIALARDLLS
ncbi:MAG: M20/M25/M40 family metallo-hydrolase [Nitriliruptorales bacterium]